MKRILVFLIIIIVLISTDSCHVKEKYRLLHQEDEITCVSIVTLTLDEVGNHIYEEKIKIDDIDTFISDFRKVECYKYFGDPIGIDKYDEGSDILKIEYENGDYELINYNGQSEYTQERGFEMYAGFNVFEIDQFKGLIEKYLSETE